MLRIELRDRIAVLTLDRPERLNAIGSGTVDRLTGALTELRDNDDVRALVVAGAGRAFSAGADIGEIESFTAPRQFHSFVQRLTDAYALLEDFPSPRSRPSTGSPSAAVSNSRSPVTYGWRSGAPGWACPR